MTKTEAAALKWGEAREVKMDAPQKKACSGCLSRRDILRSGVATVGAGAVSGALMGAFPSGCMQTNTTPSGPVPAGMVAEIAVGMLKLIEGENVILARDQAGLYAMTRVCTHQGQLVSIVTEAGMPALHCYAHGSEFSMNGAVTHGPAGRALEHLLVEVENGNVTIRGDQVVSADARTPAD